MAEDDEEFYEGDPEDEEAEEEFAAVGDVLAMGPDGHGARLIDFRAVLRKGNRALRRARRVSQAGTGAGGKALRSPGLAHQGQRTTDNELQP